MRALAHPTRLALLDHLHAVEHATATECAEVVGDSPSSCSYHLRALGKWGFVEEVARGGGRERPWRAAATQIVFSSDGPEAETLGAEIGA
jgi:DNA-binding transcriptional ArsR family regulator